jgi:two-component system, sensor histidine kinase and response regulator
VIESSLMKAMKRNKAARVSPGHQGRLLIAGDVPNDLRDAIAEQGGLMVDFSKSSREAVEMARQAAARGEHHDLVLINIDGPSPAESQTGLTIRGINGYQDVPVIAFTGNAKMPGIGEYLMAGVNDVIRLPLDDNTRVQRLQRWLSKAKEQGSAGRPHRALKPENDLYGIDMQAGLFQMGGNAQLYRDLLLKFSVNNAHFEDHLKEVLRSGATADAKRMIHTLKGLAGSFGMSRLRTLSEQVEEQIRQGAFTDIDHGLDTLSDELTKVIQAIQKKIPASEQPEIGKANTLSRKKLNELEQILHEHNPDAIRRVKEMGTVKGHEQEMERLRNAVASYQFEAALEVLKQIRVGGELTPQRRP